MRPIQIVTACAGEAIGSACGTCQTIIGARVTGPIGLIRDIGLVVRTCGIAWPWEQVRIGLAFSAIWKRCANGTGRRAALTNSAVGIILIQTICDTLISRITLHLFDFTCRTCGTIGRSSHTGQTVWVALFTGLN